MQSAGALAPSLAADLHLSDNPVNYFARKNNIFNLYFVKIGWLWTTVAFASLLTTQPAYRSSSSLPSSQQQNRARRTLQAVFRYTLATAVWYFMTQWFFGPAIIDRSFVVTGGKCERILSQSAEADANSSPAAQIETLFSAATCKAAGGSWKGGHDISGHVFMLVLATALLAFEAMGAGVRGSVSRDGRTESDNARERKSSDPDTPSVSEHNGTSGLGATWSLRLVWSVVGLGWWMLFMTAIWFHTWLEKVSFALVRHEERFMWLTVTDLSSSGVRPFNCLEHCICDLHSPKETRSMEGHYRHAGVMNSCIKTHCFPIF